MVVVVVVVVSGVVVVVIVEVAIVVMLGNVNVVVVVDVWEVNEHVQNCPPCCERLRERRWRLVWKDDKENLVHYCVLISWKGEGKVGHRKQL